MKVTETREFSLDEDDVKIAIVKHLREFLGVSLTGDESMVFFDEHGDPLAFDISVTISCRQESHE